MSRLLDLQNLHARVAYEIECELARQRGQLFGPPPTPAVIRGWARNNGYTIGERGRLPKDVVKAYLAHCRIGVTA